MAGSNRFEIDGVLNASGIAKGAQDGAKALSDLEAAVGDVAAESGQAGGKVDSFAAKLVDAARKAGKSDDDIKDALRNMGLSAKQAERAVEDIGDEYRDTGREGERAGDKLEDSLRDVQRQAGKTADEVGDVGDKGFRKLADAAEETSSELKQNLGETFSSFRGDLEDLPQLAQDVFGGLAGSVNSLSASLGLAGAAGAVGLLISAIQLAGQEQQKVKDRASEWADVYIEAGGRVLDFETQMSGIRKVITEQYDDAAKNAELWGVSIQTAAAAMSGSEEAINRAQAGIDKMKAGADELAATGATVTDEFGNITIAGSDLAGTAVAGQAALDGFKRSLELATSQADAYNIALIDMARATEGATESVDEFGDTVISLPNGKKVYIDAETGRATQDVDAIEQKIYGVKDKTVTINARTSVDTSEVDRAIRRLSNTTLRIGTRFVDNGWD